MIKPIHPFPARMAPEIVWKKLPKSQRPIRVLDPMAGSGTTVATARLRGHQAVGFDRDPLAVLIAGAWVANVDAETLERKGAEVLERAQGKALQLTEAEAFPRNANEETRQFVEYWFDETNRIQLTALADTISRLHDSTLRNLMWCAFSRLIITKKRGVSLAWDVSHSRPHRTYDIAPVKPFDCFTQSLKRVIKASPFVGKKQKNPAATVENGDARFLPLKDKSIDLVITSPPYLNAIDYLRGHKLSLVWMGYGTDEIRKLRATNVGTEIKAEIEDGDNLTEDIMKKMCAVDELTARGVGMLRQYVRDMKDVLAEICRVLCDEGTTVLVVGNCNVGKTFVQNSRGIELLAENAGLTRLRSRKRPLPENRRYLPPPESSGAGKQLKKRMREEVVLTFSK